MKKEKQHIDLFEDYENIPSNIQKILDKYEDAFMDGSYDGLLKAHKAVNKLGYTFEYYLDGQAYGLRPNDVPLNKLKGYEDEPDEMAKGGSIKKRKLYGVVGYGENENNYNEKNEEYEDCIDVYGYDKHWDSTEPTTIEKRLTEKKFNEDLVILNSFKNIKYVIKNSFSDEDEDDKLKYIQIISIDKKTPTIEKLKQFVEIEEDKYSKGGNIEDSGLMVIGRTTIDNTRIGDIIEQNDFYAEWNPNEEFWFFPEEVENYDGLEQQLEELFIEEGINARFEGIFAKGGSIDEDLITFITDNAMPSISISISEEDVIREAKAYFKWRKDVTVKKIRSLGSNDYDKFITHLSKKGYKYSPKYEKGGSVDKIKKGDSVYYIRQFTAGKIVGVVIDIDKDGKYANVRNTIGDIDYVPVNALKKYVKQQLSKFKNNMITANEIDNVHEWVGLDFSKEQIKEVFDAIEEYTGYDYPKDFKTNASPFNDFEPAHKKVDEIFESLSIAALEGDDLTESDIRDILWGIVMSAQNKYEKGGRMPKKSGYPPKMTNEEIVDYLKDYNYAVVEPLNYLAGLMDKVFFISYGAKMGYLTDWQKTKEECMYHFENLQMGASEGGFKLKAKIIKLTPEVIKDIVLQTNYMYTTYKKGGTLTSNAYAQGGEVENKKDLIIHAVGIMPNGNYAVFMSKNQEDLMESLKNVEITDNYTIVGTSGSFQTDRINANRLNNLAHKIGKEHQKTGKIISDFDKMATGGEIEFSPVAVEEANLEQLFDMAKELGLTNFQNLNKEVLRKKILEHFKLNRFRGKMATGGEVILKRDGYFKNENSNEYIEKINNYYNKWRNINTEKDSENFKKIKPPVFGTYGDKNILEQINHFEKLGVPLYDNFVMRNSFKNEISKIIPYDNKKMATGGEIKNITKQLDDLGVKYTLSKSNFRLFDEIIKPIDKKDSFYDKFNRIIQLYNLEGVVRTKMETGGEVEDLLKQFKYKDGTIVKKGDLIELAYSKYGFHPRQQSIMEKYEVFGVDDSYRTPRLILWSNGDKKDLTVSQVAELMPYDNNKMATGGEVLGRNIKFTDYNGETRNGVITESLDGGNFAVSSGFGSFLVTPEMVISFDEKPQEVKKKLFGFFEEGGSIRTDIAVIYIDEYPYYLKKLGDSTHFNMSNSKEGVDLVIPSHIGQHNGTPYYNDIRSWLKGGESPDGKRYIDKLKEGGTIADADKKSDGRFLNKISNRVDKVWDMIGAKSGGQIRSDKEMLGSYAEKALIEVEKLGLKKNSLTSKDFAFFTNRNDHLLNEFLVWNNFYYTKFAKKEKLNYLDLFKEYPLSYCDPSIIKVVTDDEKYIPHSKIDSITVIIDGKEVRIQGKDVLNGANR